MAAYHLEQLRALLEHVREGFVRLDAGEIDEFELDDLVYRYKRAAKHLARRCRRPGRAQPAAVWVFCEPSGSRSLQTATALAFMRGRAVERDWWAESASPRDQP